MKPKSFIVMAFVLMVGCAAGYAEDTYAMRINASEAHEKADAELNAVYRELSGTLNEEARNALIKAQRAWIAYRDAAAVSEGMLYEGGTFQPVAQLRASTELTIERTNRLKEMFMEGYPGDRADISDSSTVAAPEAVEDKGTDRAQAVAAVNAWLEAHEPEYRLVNSHDYWPGDEAADPLQYSLVFADFNHDRETDAAFMVIGKEAQSKNTKLLIVHDILSEAPEKAYALDFPHGDEPLSLAESRYTSGTVLCVHDDESETVHAYTGELPIGLPYLDVCEIEGHCWFVLVFDASNYIILNRPELGEDTCGSVAPAEHVGTPVGPAVKGLQLGMNIREAATLLARLEMPGSARQDGSLMLTDFLGRRTAECAQGMLAVWKLYADDDLNVDEIYLSGMATGIMFGSQDLSGEEFAQAFVDAYGVPEMQGTFKEAGILEQIGGTNYHRAWEYTNRDRGWYLRIEEDKSVVLKRVAPASRLSFD